MSTPATPAIEAIRATAIDHRVVTHGRVKSAAEAADARGIPLAALVKTIVVRLADADYRLVAIGGDRAIDWPRLRERLGVTRLSLADQDSLVDVTGYPRGVVTPFGAMHPWPLIVDRRLVDHPEVSIGGGAHGVAIHLSPADLVDHFGADVAEISRPAPVDPIDEPD